MPASHLRRVAALAVLLLGAAMVMLDLTIVNVALPSLRASLGAGEAIMSWTIAGFSLANALILIPAGRLGDRLGHAWVFLAGIALFAGASLSSGLAEDPVHLIASRVLQGLGGGMVLPMVGALIQLMYEGRERARPFAALGATIGVTAATGPLLGGLIIAAFGQHDGWRCVFFINVPLGVLAIVATLLLLPKRTAAGSGGFDPVGLVLITVALAAVLVPIIEGRDWGWPWWAIAVIAAGLLLLVAFGAWQRRVAAAGRTPLVPHRLFARLAFTGGVVLAFVYFAAFTCIFFALSILWQAGMGHSALDTGLMLVPFSAASVVGAICSPRAIARLGRASLALGVGLLTIGLGIVWGILVLVPGDELDHWQLLAPLAMAGLGSGLFITPNIQFIVATVERSVAGAANGVISTMQRIGAALGVAVAGTVIFALHEQLAADGASEIDAFAHGVGASIGISALLGAIAFCLVFTLPKRVGH